MIEVSEEAEELLPRLDTLLFDMDGVLLDITNSIRQVNCLVVPFYLREVLRWAADDDLITPAEIEQFKHAGGFNDDIELTCAIILHYLVKEHEHPGATLATLNVFKPNLQGLARRIAEAGGGGLKVAESLCMEHLTRDDKTDVLKYYRKDLIKQVFCELFGGAEAKELFDIVPKYYHGEGYWKRDVPIIDVERLKRIQIALPKTKLGILTGRYRGEAELGLRLAGLTDVIPSDQMVTSDDGPRKPRPNGLVTLVKKLNATAAVYIGDTKDDFQTVRNYRTANPDGPPMLGALVLSGPMGESNTKIFRKTHVDIVATDVNEVLRWIEEKG